MTNKLTELDARLDRILKESETTESALYDNEAQEEFEKQQLARIEEGYRALNKRLAATNHNRWGYSPAGWLSKNLVSKSMNRTKHGIYSIFPIPCKGPACPYGSMCPALQANIEVVGEPCPIETTKIENLIVSYSNDFKIESSSTTDRVFLQELIQLDLLMDRCQMLMAIDGSPLQEISMGATNDGSIYTQPVVSRYLEAWEKLSKRRQSLLNDMLATRSSRKGIKEDKASDDDLVLKMANQEGFFTVEERPDKFK